MPVLSRNQGPRGARFFDEGGELMFVHVLDGSTRFGPRPATDEDLGAFPVEFGEYQKRAMAERDNTQADFPGAPPVTFSDPPGGPPAKREPRPRGRQ